MTTLRLQLAFSNQNGLPADVVTNTWHIESNSVDPIVDAGLSSDALETFYLAIDGYLSSALTGDVQVKAYDLENPEPRVPIFTTTWGLSTGTGAKLPNEVAICLSYHGQAISGFPAGRARGRIFLGPLDGGVLDEGANDGVIQSGVCSDIAAQAAAFLVAGDPANWRWAVFSPTSAGSPPWSPAEIAGGTLPVVDGWVDNAFDTIRSRGTAATTRAFIL